jgi:hypothetical protein
MSFRKILKNPTGIDILIIFIQLFFPEKNDENPAPGIVIRDNPFEYGKFKKRDFGRVTEVAQSLEYTVFPFPSCFLTETVNGTPFSAPISNFLVALL